ncbi:unnamed protein product, partial [Ixodes persulcatus]
GSRRGVRAPLLGRESRPVNAGERIPRTAALFALSEASGSLIGATRVCCCASRDAATLPFPSIAECGGVRRERASCFKTEGVCASDDGYWDISFHRHSRRLLSKLENCVLTIRQAVSATSLWGQTGTKRI